MSDGDDEPGDAADEAAAPDDAEEEPADQPDETAGTDEPDDDATDEAAADAEGSEAGAEAADDETEGADADDEATSDGAEAEEPTDDETDDAESTNETDDAAEPADEDAVAADLDEDELTERLDEVEAAIEDAETEADLDDVAAQLDSVETAVETAELPEPDDEDEDGPRAALESRVGDLRDEIEAERGPYAADVIEDVESAKETLGEAEWTADGEEEAAAAVAAFADRVDEILDASIAVGDSFPGDHQTALEDATDAIEAADLDPDEDAETIADLVEAAEELAAGLDEAEEWEDLTVVEQLDAQGYYDRLGSENRRDFPPELNVIRIAERENDPERILLGFDYFESDFMEENCIDAFRRMGAPEAYDAMMELAERRNEDAIEVVGKIGNEDACETFHEFIQDESNPPLQKTVLRALGEIGSETSTQAVANRLVAEDPAVRSHAARALGRIGDTRAIDPLADALDDDESDDVRGAAAWALYQIGTEAAFEALSAYVDDHSYVVEVEAEKAAEALDAAAPSA